MAFWGKYFSNLQAAQIGDIETSTCSMQVTIDLKNNIF